MITHTNIDSKNISLSSEIAQVTGYLACERIVIQYIQNIIEHSAGSSFIENHLKRIIHQLESALATTEDNNAQINHRFAIGFIHTLLRMPGWQTWIYTLYPSATSV